MTMSEYREICEAIDGPFYAPNKVRRVGILREADVPGFVRCVDLDTKERLMVHRGKLMAQKEEAGNAS